MTIELTPDMRALLSHRSVRDKIGVPVDPDVRPAYLLPALFELERQGCLVWIDRGTTATADPKRPGAWLVCDVYLLTSKGLALCERHGIGRK
jgi:hypothetical protein